MWRSPGTTSSEMAPSSGSSEARLAIRMRDCRQRRPTATGVYRIEVLVSSQFSTSRFRMALDGQNVTGSLSVPNTGSWHTFQWVGASGVGLTMGLHVLRVYADQQYFNLDAIRIRK